MKYFAVDVRLARTVRFMIAREKIGGGLVTICELHTEHERNEMLEALNRPYQQPAYGARVPALRSA
jgi:hypothetical protein